MKKIILILLLITSIGLPQAGKFWELAVMYNDESTTVFPYTDNLYLAFDERGISGSSWQDNINGLDAVQATADYQPALVLGGLNGYNTLSFDGSNDRLATANLTVQSKPFTVYLVFKPVSWEANDRIFNFYTSSTVMLIEAGAANRYYPTNEADYPYYATLTVDTWYILAITFHDASSTLQVNNGSVSTNTISMTNLIAQPFEIGGSGGFYSSNMEIACLYFYTSTAHDLATRTQIVNWLNDKYNIY